MKSFKSTIFILVGICLLAFAGYFFYVKQPAQNASLQVPAYLEKVTNDSWQVYEPKSRSFKILFPKVPPQHVATSQAFENSKERIIYNVYSSIGSDATTYMLSIVQYPPSFDISSPKSILQTTLQQMTQGSLHNTIVGQKSVAIGNCPAIEFDLQNVEFATLGRAMMNGSTLYVLTVMNRDRNHLEENYRQFVDSFEIRNAVR